tara:strand:- start:161 stop:853 length:693 start_codon:yes stop_codon:yes gene_type:complete
MNDLLALGKQFKSTKEWTGFLEIYSKYFEDYKDKEINILEIGIDKGESLKIWRKYFSKAKICGIDIIDIDFKIEGVDIIKADQTDKKALKEICEKYKNFDIIIDDGSHRSKQIIISLNFLFDYLNNNGLYVIEDLQTSYFPRFGGSRINLKKKGTSMNFLKSITDSINYENNDKPFFRSKKFDGMIKYIHFYQNVAILKKGKSISYFYKNIKKSNTIINKIKKLFFIFNN